MRRACCEKEGTNKGAWSKQEDQKLIDYVRVHGEGCWRSIPKAAGLHRCGKSCRLRWINYLRPDIKRGNFAEDEEDLIIKLHALLGNRWSLIAGRLPGRTDNEVKNYWNSHIRRKLVKMGIDPNNHKLHHRSLIIKPSSASNAVDNNDDRIPNQSSPLEETVTATATPMPMLVNASSFSSSSSQLNLDLTIAFPSSSSSSPTLLDLGQHKASKPPSSEVTNNIARNVEEDESSPALLLFQ